jgi:hypothetical protein
MNQQPAGQEEDPRPLRQTTQGPKDETWQASGGTLRLTWTDAGAVRIWVRGHGAGAFAAVITARFDRVLGQSGTLTMLYDFEEMATYNSQLRSDLTAWCHKHRDRIRGLHVLTASRIVAMGVAVANVALGGLITVHKGRPSFQAAQWQAGLQQG